MVQNLNQLYTEAIKLGLKESTADVFNVDNPGMNTGIIYGPPSDPWKQSLG